MNRIYLDNAATTELDPRVAKAMRNFESAYFGNPNSIHREGQQARAEIDFARESLAKFFNCRPQEIIFTSGATEANNQAIQGIVSQSLNKHADKPHVITTEFEHSSVYNAVKELKRKGVIEATFIKPNKDGLISAESVIKEIQNNTVLISAIFVSNEIGAVLPVREIGKLLAEYNRSNRNSVCFHIDAVQAVKFYNCNLEKLGADLVTFSSHKINGPKGIGGLFIKSGTKIDNLMFGGSQEYDKRPGTQNTAGIIGMAKAYEVIGDLSQRERAGEKIRKLKNNLIENLKPNIKISFNGPADDQHSCPDILSFSINGADQDLIMAKLDLAGIAASTGSACVSGSTEPSHVIKALGKVSKKPSATVRISIGKGDTAADLATVAKFFNPTAKHLK